MILTIVERVGVVKNDSVPPSPKRSRHIIHSE
jgi:hypothetical protein